MNGTGATDTPTPNVEHGRAHEHLDIEPARAKSLAALCVHLEATRAVLERHDIAMGLQLLREAHELASAALLDNRYVPGLSRHDDASGRKPTPATNEAGDGLPVARRELKTAVRTTFVRSDSNPLGSGAELARCIDDGLDN